MTFGAHSRITPTCVHGNRLGACLDCHRDQNGWDPRTGLSEDSAGATANPGAIVLRESGQNYFITSFSNGDHWATCKDKGLWGTRLSSSKAASDVRADDLVVIWEASRGLRAVVKAVSLSQQPRTPDEVPWPDPQLYVYLFPIEVLIELDEPVGDDFEGPDRISARFGLKKADLQSGFRRLEREQMARILDAVNGAAPQPDE